MEIYCTIEVYYPCVRYFIIFWDLLIIGLNLIFLYFFASLQSIKYFMFLYYGMRQYCHQ
jgi:hypothetical protein